MGHLIDERSFIDNNVFLYEERMNSQYSRFLDKTPTFVSYYNINNITSITDVGFLNVERIIGPDSPVKFKKIDDFPVFGLDPILLELNDEDEGLDTSYDSELIILPNTIKPLPNDCFTITYLDKNYLFMVTEVKYDTIKSNNYYKISFGVKSLSPTTKENLINQIDETYNCILTNIGTQEKCIIRSDLYIKIIELNDLYREICERYKILFYNSKYNSFMFIDESSGIKYYDRFLTHFINSHKLFNERYQYDTLFLVNEDLDSKFPLEYEKSVYRIIEKNKKDNLPDQINYITGNIKNLTSIFHYYRDLSIKNINFSESDGYAYIDSTLISDIKAGIKSVETAIINNAIIDYFNKTITAIDNFNIDSLKECDYIDYDFKSFITIPILLFILRTYYNKFIAH